MFSCDPDALGNSGGRWSFAVLDKMFDFLEYPWIANSCATDHDPIHAVTAFKVPGLFGRVNIAIPKNRYAHALILLDLAYQGPVCRSFIHLHPGSSVDSECLNPDILQTLGY